MRGYNFSSSSRSLNTDPLGIIVMSVILRRELICVFTGHKSLIKRQIFFKIFLYSMRFLGVFTDCQGLLIPEEFFNFSLAP